MRNPYICEWCGKHTDKLNIGMGHPYCCDQCFDEVYNDVGEDEE